MRIPIGLALLVFAMGWAHADAKSEAHDLYKKGDFSAALAKYRQAAHEHPNDPAIYWNLGFTYRRLQKYAEALSSFEKAGKLDPTHSFASKSGKYEEALAGVRAKIPQSKATSPSATKTSEQRPEIAALKTGSVYVDPSRRDKADAKPLLTQPRVPNP